MTNIRDRDYRRDLCNEFIKNEEDWINRSSNIDELKKARKIKEREEDKHKKNVDFFISLGMCGVILMVILGSLIYTFHLLIPKSIDEIENKYNVTYYTYFVSEGETLHDIRENIMKINPDSFNKVNRWNYDELLTEINDLDNPNMIYPGQEIIYPVF